MRDNERFFSTRLLHSLILILFLCAIAPAQVQNDQAEGRVSVADELRANKFQAVLQAAKAGDATKQLMLSHLYRAGYGTNKDEREADFWLLKSAENGRPEAQVELGRSLVEHNRPDTGFAWFLKAAQAGNAVAQDFVAHCYVQGLGTEVNYEEGMQWLLKAAAQGSPLAVVNIGYMYEHGKGVPVDYEKALQWYKLAAEKGVPLGQVNLGAMYLRGVGVRQDFKEAERWLSQAVAQGAPEAYMNLAIVYLEGPPELKNTEKAVQLLESAVAYGLPNASTLLAQLYLTNQVPNAKRDSPRVMELLKPAAEAGNVHAQVLIGTVEQEAKRFKAAEYWFSKAAEQNDGRAMFGLAELYNRGQGVPRDFEKASKLYVQANDLVELALVANNAGWFFATCEDVKYRNPELAIKYALKAVQLSENKFAGFLDTLAEAYFVNAQYGLAVSTEERALELDPSSAEFKKSLARFQAALDESKAAQNPVAK